MGYVFYFFFFHCWPWVDRPTLLSSLLITIFQVLLLLHWRIPWIRAKEGYSSFLCFVFFCFCFCSCSYACFVVLRLIMISFSYEVLFFRLVISIFIYLAFWLGLSKSSLHINNYYILATTCVFLKKRHFYIYSTVKGIENHFFVRYSSIFFSSYLD